MRKRPSGLSLNFLLRQVRILEFLVFGEDYLLWICFQSNTMHMTVVHVSVRDGFKTSATSEVEIFVRISQVKVRFYPEKVVREIILPVLVSTYT